VAALGASVVDRVGIGGRGGGASALALCLLVALLAACAGPAAQPEPEAAARPQRIVLVVVDTLRRDRLGLYGHPRPTSPALDAWAASGTVFTQARSPSPWTLPSVRALLGADGIEAFDPGGTVPVRLQAEGWRTAAVLANPNVGAAAGLGQGWDAHHLDADAAADDQVDRALAVLDAHDADGGAPPLFLLLHLMDPHLPYAEGPAHRSLFAGEPPTARTADPLQEPKLKGDNALRSLTAAELRYLSDRYDQNVRAVDDALARLLPRLGPADLVVVTSDHGEALGEHGGIGHGQGLTEEQVAIPLVLAGPGWRAGRRDVPVGLDDVGATVLAAAGVVGPAGGSGRDLAALLAAPVDRPQRLSHTHYGPARFGVVAGTDKRVGTATEVRRVDLSTDPAEEAPEAGAWTASDRALWEAAGGAPLVAVASLQLSAPAAYRPPGAPADVRAVRITHPDGVARVWWPSAPLREATPERVPVPGGVELRVAGPRCLSNELWVALPEGADRAALSVEVSRRGEWVPGSALPGFAQAAGWAPPPVSRVAPGARDAATDGALEALGYIEPAPGAGAPAPGGG
jgi:arylsulfatase